MSTIKNYVEWKLTHSKKQKKSRNLFDKDNFVIQGYFHSGNVVSTETGVSFEVAATATSTIYGQLRLALGLASDFKGKTITFSSPSTGGTAATKIAVYNGATSVQNGSNWTKSGDIYYSTITVEDKEYTTAEQLTLLLYYYSKNPGDVVTYDEIMVNEGAEPLPYEPYK